MNILHITPQAPNYNSGGSMGVLQTVLSLAENGYKVDYVGPEIEIDNIKDMYCNCFFLAQDKFVIRRIINLIRGITNSRYSSWEKLKINLEFYDVIVMDFTKLDYILHRIGNKTLIVKVHNVEYDYSWNDYKKNKTFSKWVVAKLSFRQEKKILERADNILVLSLKDKNRLIELYGVNLENKISVNPVSISAKHIQRKEKKGHLKMLITGSLWYGENANGVIWFVQEVFSKLNNDFELTVAGARPNKELKTILSGYNNVTIVDTPQSIELYFYECDLFVAPIFSGAGMKVKVAEALSYGKPVLGTDHAFIGYKIQDGINSFEANTAEEFVMQLNKIIKMDEYNWNSIVDNAINLFKAEYSIENSARQWNNGVIMAGREKL